LGGQGFNLFNFLGRLILGLQDRGTGGRRTFLISKSLDFMDPRAKGNIPLVKNPGIYFYAFFKLSWEKGGSPKTISGAGS